MFCDFTERIGKGKKGGRPVSVRADDVSFVRPTGTKGTYIVMSNGKTIRVDEEYDDVSMAVSCCSSDMQADFKEEDARAAEMVQTQFGPMSREEISILENPANKLYLRKSPKKIKKKKEN